MIEQLLPPTRLKTPSTPSTLLDVDLPTFRGASDDEDVVLGLVVHGVEAGATVLAQLGLHHSPEGSTTAIHTSGVIALTAVAAGDSFVGEADRTKVLLDHGHPKLGITSTGSGDKWVTLSVWQLRKRYRSLRDQGTVRLIGQYRLDSSSYTNSPGVPTPASPVGKHARVVSYHVHVKEASASAQLGGVVEHSFDGIHWAVHSTTSPAAVASGEVKVFDCDIDAALGPFTRLVMTMQSTAGQRAQLEVWELSKTV